MQKGIKMIKGILKVINGKQIDLLHSSILEVLEKTGLKISGDFLLKTLADYGCRVDFKENRVWFKSELVEKQIAYQKDRYRMVRSSLWYPFCKELPKNDVAWPDEFCIDYGFGAVHIYDYPSGRYLEPKIKDQIAMIKLGNALDSVKAICAPFICSDFDSRVETIESSRILLLNTKKPGWVGTNYGREVKYLAELAYIAADNNEFMLRTNPPIIVTAYCTTSPLKIDYRSCDVLKESIKYKFPINFASMPILGGTTPITPAGSVVIAAAEILGGITAASLIDPEIYYYGTVISGEMDMKTTNIRYATPAAVLTDATLHQLFKYKYGIVLNVEPAYIEAKTPGIQASILKLYRQMTLSCTASSSLPIGLLDNASTFSPTQAIIDLDVNKAIYEFGKGIEISEETVNVDLINRYGFCEAENYLGSEQTLKYYRDILWDSKLLNTEFRKKEFYKTDKMDEEILNKSDKIWRSLVDSQKDPEFSPNYKAKIDKVVNRAKEELLRH
jgi:trimethylamine---corrinoid protein Co-methyltransferase